MARDYDAAFDSAAEREYLDQQEYAEMMADAPDDYFDEDDCWLDEDEPDSALDEEYDGQPDEYTEWQDYYGGDDWDHGQYDYDY